MSPFYYPYAIVFAVDSAGILNWGSVSGSIGIRPVINIRADVQLTGTGSQNDPFVVVGAN